MTPKKYKILNKQRYEVGDFALVPIRMEDRENIRVWRNEQMYHLRQNAPLSQADQEQYFDKVVYKLFTESSPKQLLFSYLKNEQCIGYGGLVHINWTEKTAEISFIMETKLEVTEFEKHWTLFLLMLEDVAFLDLRLNKIFTYAYNLRPHLFTMLEHNNYRNTERLIDEVKIDGVSTDVLIHEKPKPAFQLRIAEASDEALTYKWASNSTVRQFALTQTAISFDEHKAWFERRLKDTYCHYYIATIDKEPIGSIRFDMKESAQISYLLDPKYHSKGLGKSLLYEGMKKAISEFALFTFTGDVMDTNIASTKIFNDLGFEIDSQKDGITKYIRKF